MLKWITQTNNVNSDVQKFMKETDLPISLSKYVTDQCFEINLLVLWELGKVTPKIARLSSMVLILFVFNNFIRPIDFRL